MDIAARMGEGVNGLKGRQSTAGRRVRETELLSVAAASGREGAVRNFSVTGSGDS